MNTNTSADKDASYFRTSGVLIIAAKEWTSIVENFPYGLAALIFYYILFQVELVPRWLSVWGLIGGALMLAMGLLRMFGKPVIFLAIPILLNELVLAVWFIVIGFNSSTITLIIVGALFVTALFSSMLSGVFAGSLEQEDYITAASANDNKVLVGVLLQLTLTISVVAIPILMFPILTEYSESLALGYVVARSFEGVADAVMAICMLVLLTLSREYAKVVTPAADTGKNQLA